MKKLLAIAISFCFTCLLGEVVLRLPVTWFRAFTAHKQVKDFYYDAHGNSVQLCLFDKFMGWRLHPGIRCRWKKMLPEPLFDVEISVNNLGLRDREYAHNTPPGKQRILVLGDSFVFGHGVEDKERFSELLEDSYFPNTEFINAGVMGYGTDQTLLAYQFLDRQLRPDLVMYFFLPAHVLRNISDADGDNAKSRFTLQPDQSLAFSYASSWASKLNHSSLYRFLRFVNWHYEAQRIVHFAAAEPFNLTEQLLATMLRLARSRGIEMIIVSIPDRDMCAAADRTFDFGQYGVPVYTLNEARQFIRQFCYRYSVEYHDLIDDFKKYRDAKQKLFWETDPHWNPEGHAFVAERLAPDLRARGYK